MDAFTGRRERPVLLIDADNFKEELWLERAKSELQKVCGQTPVIKAYGAMSSLQSRHGIWNRLGAELVPNLALDKNTTDASLITDAVELCLQAGFRFFAIASGDADFAPLVVRLRRWGCTVWCFGDAQTVFHEADKYYDKVVRCELSVRTSSVTAPLAVAAATDAHNTVTSPVPKAKHSEDVCPATAAASVSARKSIVKIPAMAAQQMPALHGGNTFRSQVLTAVPQLATGKALDLSRTIHALRQKGVISNSEKLTTWVKKFGDGLVLLPQKAPNQLRLHTTNKAPAAVAACSFTPVVHEVVCPGTISSVFPALQPAQHALRCVLWELIYQKLTVADVLITVPELLDKGQCFSTASVARRLRQKGYLAPAHSLRKACERHAQSFELNFETPLPYVRYLG